VDPVPDPLLLRKSGRAGNRARISGSVARNSDQYTTEAVDKDTTYKKYRRLCAVNLQLLNIQSQTPKLI
jgi:hypothetical protein